MTSLVRIDQTLLSNLSQRARQHSRRRLNHNFHEPPDVVNRMLNAIEPDSYICPHRHQHPPLEESFLVLRGAGAVIVFTEVGEVEDILVLDSRRRAGVWKFRQDVITQFSLELSVACFTRSSRGLMIPNVPRNLLLGLRWKEPQRQQLTYNACTNG